MRRLYLNQNQNGKENVSGYKFILRHSFRPSHPYRGTIPFSDNDTFFNLLSNYLKDQVEKVMEDEEIMEELEEINLQQAEKDIKEGIREIKADLEKILKEEGQERRLIITVPEILTDWHIEIFGPEKIDAYPVKDNKIAILASDIVEGCGPRGEFLEVVQIVSPDEDEDFSEIDYELNRISCDPFEAMSGVEKWNSLVGEGSIVEVIS